VSAPHDHLADARYITVILRLMISPPDQLHGEIAGADDKQRRRFTGWSGLTRALRDWLNERYPGLITSDQPPQPDRTERS
jgi:hypothetical protein